MFIHFFKKKLRKFRFLYIIRDYFSIPKLEKVISGFLPECNCIDVGASYFEHSKWRVFLKSRKTNWIAVDPNAHNLTYLKNWRWNSKLKVVDQGLSQNGGEVTLYVTNVDSGSSIKKPKLSDSMKLRMVEENYFFPYQEKKIITKSLKTLIEENYNPNPFFIKLDTQGTELDILKGADLFFKKFQILGVELETCLLAQPCYEDANKFTDVANFFEEKGYELININIFDLYSTNKDTNSDNFFPNEIDVVFLPRLDIINKLPLNYKLSIIGFMYSYKLYNQIKYLIKNNLDLKQELLNRQINMQKLMK
jgi:FkbM family methyltransferase